jgi:hypothetical protein
LSTTSPMRNRSMPSTSGCCCCRRRRRTYRSSRTSSTSTTRDLSRTRNGSSMPMDAMPSFSRSAQLREH